MLASRPGSGSGMAHTDTPGDRAAPDRPANLRHPVDQPPGGDYGAHGVFDAKSKPHSAQLWLAEHAEAAGSVVSRVLGAIRNGAGHGNGAQRGQRRSPASHGHPAS
jgi:hypothetical protein